MSTTTTAFLAGSTGLVGSNILSTLIARPEIAHTHAFTRRPLPHSSPRLSTLPADAEHESAAPPTWPTHIPNPAPASSIFVSALGTTRAQAGSLDAQRQIDYELNLALATAAKAAGITTYVLVSTAQASAASIFPYTRMKGELEDRVKALGFAHCVILRPGLIVGAREDSRPAEFVVRKVAGLAGAFANGLKDFWAQDALVIARAAVHAGLLCARGEREDGVWELAQADIVRLGRTEWKDAAPAAAEEAK
ncbi:uncharacterized protein K452DRAFT_232551 [Aplosporella prunicola CBS 121167]|uniref:NAD(P)-binding domain-containing protein n=1 Tax=Aplosporella prunicola CBS 121167 TaxID=1176127 RepID=A0A6A6B696_9PEZI|nr:uncharacterized protein K452DRAFT_232551 [Aplosporella prunicola CBS 121167]KAF2139386.1 hypothetical protein K452DRAFT_232551 [Aplosporella prunicola CBS 121167]